MAPGIPRGLNAQKKSETSPFPPQERTQLLGVDGKQAELNINISRKQKPQESSDGPLTPLSVLMERFRSSGWIAVIYYPGAPRFDLLGKGWTLGISLSGISQTAVKINTGGMVALQTHQRAGAARRGAARSGHLKVKNGTFEPLRNANVSAGKVEAAARKEKAFLKSSSFHQHTEHQPRIPQPSSSHGNLSAPRHTPGSFE